MWECNLKWYIKTIESWGHDLWFQWESISVIFDICFIWCNKNDIAAQFGMDN